jgi:hypothetical protein
MYTLRNVPLVTVNTFLSPVPSSWDRGSSCPPLGRTSSLRREALQLGLTSVRVSGLKCRQVDSEVLALLEHLGFAAGELDFVYVPRRAGHGFQPNTNFGYFFAVASSSFELTRLVDALGKRGYSCTRADVQGFDVNLANFWRKQGAAQAWVATGRAWRRIER